MASRPDSPLSDGPIPRSSELASLAEAPRGWHQREVTALWTSFDTHPDTGLSASAAQAALQQYGENRLAEPSRRSPWGLLLEQFLTLPVGLLMLAAALSYGTGGRIDAGVILGVVAINAAIGYFTEAQSERIIRSLRTEDAAIAVVIRDGQEQQLPLEQLVPGDRLVLRRGDPIPADARIIDAQGLSLDEAVLTGESLAVEKTSDPLPPGTIPLAERRNLVYRGTRVTRGQGSAIVVATGSQTELGKIQQLVGTAETVETPLQQQLGRAGGQLVLLSSGVCVLVFVLGAWRGYPLLEMFKTAVSLAVAAVPEGLPAIATTTLALGVRRMRRAQIFIRNLEAVEALGSIQTLCIDKTGTLTQNKMAVAEVQLSDIALSLGPDQPLPAQLRLLSPAQQRDLQQLAQVLLLCREDQPACPPLAAALGSPSDTSGTEAALSALAQDLGLSCDQLHPHYLLQALWPRQDGQPRVASYHRHSATGQGLFALKGNPSVVLSQCRYWRGDGGLRDLGDRDRQQLDAHNERLSGQGLRVLGFAYRLDGQAALSPSLDATDAVWLGWVGLADPIRPGMTALIQAFHRAGIDTVMLTGDQSTTARAIATTIHLNRRPDLQCLDASVLQQMSEQQRQVSFAQADVFSRVSPADKLAIVQALQAKGKVVAMIGDGINDTPALKAADVGIAMGSSAGTGVHDVANLVVADDNFQTLIQAIAQGRTIYSNIRKSVHFLLSTNISEIVVTTVMTSIALGPAFSAMQLLWLNLVTDVFPGLALALEPPEPGVLEQPPRPSDEPILKRSDLGNILRESLVISLCALAAYGFALGRYGGSEQANTVLFMSLTLGQILHTFHCRSETYPGLGRSPLARNPYVEGAIVGTLLLQLLPLAIPSLQQLLHLAPLQAVDWGLVGGWAIAPLGIHETLKRWSMRQRQSQDSALEDPTS